MWNKFDCNKDTLLKQFKEDNWIEESGLTFDALNEKCQIILNDESKSLGDRKAEAISFILNNAQIDIVKDEFFQNKLNFGSMYNTIMDKFHCRRYDYLEKVYCKDMYDKINDMNQSAICVSLDFCHIAPDWNFLMKYGFVGIIDRLKKERKNFENNAEKLKFYDQCIQVYEAMIACLKRMAFYAKKFGTEKQEFVAENLLAIANGAPQNLAQAMQLTMFMYHIETSLDPTVIRSLGYIDRLYYPFYKNDLESGKFTEEQLRELTKDFFWKITSYGITTNLPLCICGKYPDGTDATNPYTFLMIEEYKSLDILDPKIHLVYHKNINKNIVLKVLDSIRDGKSSFVFVNAEIAEKALQKIGVSEEDSKKLIVYGCYEIAAEGTEIPPTCAGRINMAKSMEFAFYNGFDPSLNKQVGLKTGEDFESFEELLDAVKKQIKYSAQMCMDALTHYEQHYDLICPFPILSGAFENCVKTGTDVYNHGAKYNNTSINCFGIATVVDSLIVLKKLVFEEQKMSFAEFVNVLKSNWNDNEKLRLFCKNNYAKYANDINEADDLALEIFNDIADYINGKPNGRGGVFKHSQISIDWITWMGTRVGATPDGRFAKEPVSKNLCANVGQDKNGITAFMNSVLKFDATKCPNGYVLDAVIHPSVTNGDDGLEAFYGLLKTYIDNGGLAIHFNVIDSNVLRKAQLNPEEYKNLQIRLCGWNVRFVDLDKRTQDEFITKADMWVK